MGQDKVRMTHKVVCGPASWCCAIVDGIFYVADFVDDKGRAPPISHKTRKHSVEEVYEGYDGYVVKKINSFKGNV